MGLKACGNAVHHVGDTVTYCFMHRKRFPWEGIEFTAIYIIPIRNHEKLFIVHAFNGLKKHLGFYNNRNNCITAVWTSILVCNGLLTTFMLVYQYMFIR